MTYKINDRCTHCGECIYVCHTGAIEETAEATIIDALACIGCEACYDVCPHTAIEAV